MKMNMKLLYLSKEREYSCQQRPTHTSITNDSFSTDTVCEVTTKNVCTYIAAEERRESGARHLFIPPKVLTHSWHRDRHGHTGTVEYREVYDVIVYYSPNILPMQQCWRKKQFKG